MKIEKFVVDQMSSYSKMLEEEWNLWDRTDAGVESNEVKEVVGEDFSLPMAIWSIEAYYSPDLSLCFRLRTPDGAYMLLFANEVVDCIHFLVSDSNDGIYFNIQDVRGHKIQTDSAQVEAHLKYILSVEKRKKIQRKDRDDTAKKRKSRKRRKRHG